MAGKKANKGVFITTSKFRKDAIEYVRDVGQKVILIDGDQLSQYMIEFNIGVSGLINYEVKKIDYDYFTEE